MLGAEGITDAKYDFKRNYMKARLEEHYPILYLENKEGSRNDFRL
jgi:glycine cleavage system protein P-like pyridoxal-binding family